MNKTPRHSLEVGAVLNHKWVILEFVGSGAMGEVYRAHQLNLKRDVAVKIISRGWLQNLDEDEEEIETTFQRFRREVEAMAKLRHPNVLQIHDYDSASIIKGGEEMPVEYIAMEYAPGGDLRATMSEDGFYPDEEPTKSWLVNYFLPVLDGVEAMHQEGMAHRDLKPENVLLDENTPKIADFGLARSCQLKSVTQSIDAKGTPPYMSPEHFFDFRRADHRADIYSLGKILFEAVDGKLTTGTLPFKSAKLEKADTPFFQKLDQIIVEATCEDKSNRLQSVEELRNKLLDAIDVVGEGGAHVAKPTVLAHPKWIWTGITVAVLSMVLMTIWHLMGEPGKWGVKKEQIVSDDRQLSGPPIHPEGTSPARTVPGKDGANLHLVPGGPIEVPQNFGPKSDELVSLAPFYMDETQVTNRQYVRFLNQVISRISVDKDVVRGETDIWLLIGEVIEEYEPIVFRGGRFSTKDSAVASHPVLRVTAYGATAYARFYGKRLPTEIEWLQATMGKGTVTRTSANERRPETGTPTRMTRESKTESSESTPEFCPTVPFPVTGLKPNEYGLRGLNCNVSEWGIRVLRTSSIGEILETDYVVLGGVGLNSPTASVLRPPIRRHAWEAFEEVGFRCAQTAASPKN